MIGRTVSALLLVAGCATETPGRDRSGPDLGGLPVLGLGTHSQDRVRVTGLGDSADGLAKPTDLAFHPDHPDELWVVNQGDDSITIFWDVATDVPASRHARDPSGEHFLASPSGIAFGDNGRFATIHDLDEPTQGGATPADFMGPTLWSGDRDTFDGGHESHLDMLHNTPLGKGIAWEGPRNRYWVFDGEHASLTMYDFGDDHGLGGTDHTDGVVARFVEGELAPHPRLPSHLEIDPDTGLLYVADPGNGRIAVLDTAAGEPGAPIGPNLDGIELYEVDEVSTGTLVDTDAAGLGTPVGLALHDGMLWISSVDPDGVYAFDLDGVLVDWLVLDLEPNGIAFSPDGRLYVAAADDDRVLRIQPE